MSVTFNLTNSASIQKALRKLVDKTDLKDVYFSCINKEREELAKEAKTQEIVNYLLKERYFIRHVPLYHGSDTIQKICSACEDLVTISVEGGKAKVKLEVELSEVDNLDDLIANIRNSRVYQERALSKRLLGK